MGSFSMFFRTLLCSYHNIFYSCGSSDHLIDWFNWYPQIACFSLGMSLCHIIPCCNLWILNIVCLPPTIHHWICVLYFTHILRNTQFMEEHMLYWPSKLGAHFGNRCQWGRSLESFVEKFRELFIYALVLFLSICITCSCIISCCFAW